MKKFIALLLTAAMLLCVCSASVYAAEDKLSLIFVTDTHFSATDTVNPVKNSTDEDPFGYVVSNGKMTIESAAVMKEFLSQAAESDCDYVVLTGDISDTGNEADAKGIVAILEEFEQTTGKKVIASMGNHESYGMTSAEFKNYYKNLGYDYAIAVDSASASYTVDLNSKYRLILIDTNNFNQARVDWIGEQAAKAKADGKQIISVTHFSLFKHYKVQQFAHDSVIDEQYNLADKFIEWGIRFNFSGHTHELDTAEYTTDKGTVYDCTNGALTTYPACYKTAVFSEKTVELDTKYIEKIDTSMIPEGMNEVAKELLENDFRAYAKRLFLEGSDKQIQYYISASYIANAAKLNPTRDAEIISILNTVVPRLKEAFLMPLYGEGSLSELARKQRHFNIPASEYKTLLGAACEVYAQHCAGSENCSVYTPVGKVVTNGAGAALNYALDTLTAQDYKTVIDWAFNTFDIPININDYTKNFAAEQLSKADGIEYIVLYVLTPILDDFMKDPTPDDVHCVLPNYGYTQNEAVSFIERVRKFFSMILLFLNSIFAFISK